MIDVGAPYTLSFVVTNDLGNAADAATVTLVVTKPDQTTDTFSLAGATVTRDGLGLYHVSYVPATEGLYTLAWAATSPTRVQTDVFNAGIFRSIIGVNEARVYVGETDTSRDDILRLTLASLTEKVESIVGTCIQRRIVDENVTGYTAQVIRLKNGPLPSVTSVESVTSRWPGGPSWVTADFIVYPDSGTLELLSMIPFWYGPWKATYTAGRAVIPASFQLAVKEMLIDFWASQRPYGLDELEPGMDDTARWEQALSQYDIPPHAKSLLEGEEQPGFA